VRGGANPAVRGVMYVSVGDHLGWITQWQSMSNLPLISLANFSIPPCDRSMWLPGSRTFRDPSSMVCPCHHLLERILDEYIVGRRAFRAGNSCFQSVNSLGTAVTGRALNRYKTPGPAIRKRAKAAGFSPLSDVTLAGDRYELHPPFWYELNEVGRA